MLLATESEKLPSASYLIRIVKFGNSVCRISCKYINFVRSLLLSVMHYYRLYELEVFYIIASQQHEFVRAVMFSRDHIAILIVQTEGALGGSIAHPRCWWHLP